MERLTTQVPVTRYERRSSIANKRMKFRLPKNILDKMLGEFFEAKRKMAVLQKELRIMTTLCGSIEKFITIWNDTLRDAEQDEEEEESSL